MMANSAQPLLPKDLYPVVQDLSEAEYSSSSCCGEVFGGYPLENLLSPLLTPARAVVPSQAQCTSLCPCDVGDNNTEEGEDSQKNNNNGKRNQELRTPIKSNRHEKKDSIATAATSEVGLPEEEGHPLLNTPRRSRYGRFSGSTQKKARTSLLEADQDDNDEEVDESHHDRMDGKEEASGPLVSPPRRKKLHIRRRSRQLMNLLLVRSNSMSSSTKDLSITETSMESQAFHEEQPRFHEKYILIRRMLQGAASEIWECLERETGILFCVKTLNVPEDAAYAELEMHHALMNQRGHPGLVRLVESFEEQSKLYMVMEWVAGGNLLSKVVQDGPMDEARVKAITKSLVESLVFLHSQNVVHGDIEPANICLTGEAEGNTTKLVDFASAVDLSLHPPYGSRFRKEAYSAPEVLQQIEPYGCVADMWSVGCIVFFMMTGSSPFEEGPSPRGKANKNLTKILRGEYKFPAGHFHNVSRSAKQFISNLIHTDPSVRMTAMEALEHPWLRVQKKATQQQASFFRRRSSLGTNDTSPSPERSWLESNELANNGRCPLSSQSSPNSPQQQSSSKHHRRLSSLTKGLSRLFSPKDQVATSWQDCKKAHPDQPVFASSELQYPRSPSNLTVSSWGGIHSESKNTRHHRRLVTN